MLREKIRGTSIPVHDRVVAGQNGALLVECTGPPREVGKQEGLAGLTSSQGPYEVYRGPWGIWWV